LNAYPSGSGSRSETLLLSVFTVAVFVGPVPQTEEGAAAAAAGAAAAQAAPPPQQPTTAVKMETNTEENLDNLGPEELEMLTDNLEDMCKVIKEHM
jgi:hypothetical protein